MFDHWYFLKGLLYYVHKNIPHCSIGSCLPNNKMDIKLFGGVVVCKGYKMLSMSIL